MVATETMPQYRSWRKFISKEVASFFAGDDRSYRLVKCATVSALKAIATSVLTITQLDGVRRPHMHA